MPSTSSPSTPWEASAGTRRCPRKHARRSSGPTQRACTDSRSRDGVTALRARTKPAQSNPGGGSGGGRSPPPRLCLVTGVAEYPAGKATRMLTLLEQDLAVDDGVVDALGQLAYAPAAVREVVHDVARARPHRVGVEHHDVGNHSRLEQPAVVDPEGRGGVEGES